MHDWTFSGLIDEWGLYSRALAEAEVQALVAAGNAGTHVLPQDKKAAAGRP